MAKNPKWTDEEKLILEEKVDRAQARNREIEKKLRDVIVKFTQVLNEKKEDLQALKTEVYKINKDFKYCINGQI